MPDLLEHKINQVSDNSYDLGESFILSTESYNSSHTLRDTHTCSMNSSLVTYEDNDGFSNSNVNFSNTIPNLSSPLLALPNSKINSPYYSDHDNGLNSPFSRLDSIPPVANILNTSSTSIDSEISIGVPIGQDAFNNFDNCSLESSSRQLEVNNRDHNHDHHDHHNHNHMISANKFNINVNDTQNNNNDSRLMTQKLEHIQSNCNFSDQNNPNNNDKFYADKVTTASVNQIQNKNYVDNDNNNKGQFEINVNDRITQQKSNTKCENESEDIDTYTNATNKVVPNGPNQASSNLSNFSNNANDKNSPSKIQNPYESTTTSCDVQSSLHSNEIKEEEKQQLYQAITPLNLSHDTTSIINKENLLQLNDPHSNDPFSNNYKNDNSKKINNAERKTIIKIQEHKNDSLKVKIDMYSKNDKELPVREGENSYVVTKGRNIHSIHVYIVCIHVFFLYTCSIIHHVQEKDV